MSFWILVLGIAGICVLWLIVKRLFLDAVPEHKAWVTKCIDNQVRKRNDIVKVNGGTPILTVPYKGSGIDLSFHENNDELYREHTYARLRTASFADDDFKITPDSTEWLLKPVVLGEKLQIDDAKFSEKFIVSGSNPALIKDVLTPEIRDKLLSQDFQVVFGRRTDSSLLSRDRGWLSVLTPGVVIEDRVFDALIDTAILFYDRLDALDSRSKSAS